MNSSYSNGFFPPQYSLYWNPELGSDLSYYNGSYTYESKEEENHLQRFTTGCNGYQFENEQEPAVEKENTFDAPTYIFKPRVKKEREQEDQDVNQDDMDVDQDYVDSVIKKPRPIRLPKDQFEPKKTSKTKPEKLRKLIHKFLPQTDFLPSALTVEGRINEELNPEDTIRILYWAKEIKLPEMMERKGNLVPYYADIALKIGFRGENSQIAKNVGDHLDELIGVRRLHLNQKEKNFFQYILKRNQGPIPWKLINSQMEMEYKRPFGSKNLRNCIIGL